MQVDTKEEGQPVLTPLSNTHVNCPARRYSYIMRVDSLTHILPRYFVDNRDEMVRRDSTFAELFGTSPNAKIESSENLLNSMDAAEVDVSVVAGFGWKDMDAARRANDYLLESAAKHRDRLVACCSVNPLWGDVALDEVARCLAAGAKGIGELHADTQGWSDNIGEELDDLMALLSEFNAIAIIHSSEPYGHAYPGKGGMTPDRLHQLASRYPANRFVFSHLGGGLPWFAMMPEIRSALHNVWYDTAAVPYLYQSNVYSTAVAAVGADRLLFASDWPLIGHSRAVRYLASDANLSDADRRRILGINAAEVLGLAIR